MPDWGTFISDYKGKLHNVARSSFDSLSKTARDPLNVSDPVLRNNFAETFKVFKKKISNEFNLGDRDFTLEELGGKLKQQLQNTGVRMGLETGAGYLASKVAAVEGPLGILLTEAVTIAASEFTHYYAGSKSYKPGQWIFIDCGLKTKKINQDAKVVELQTNFDLFGGEDYAVIPDDLDYVSEPNHTIGFYLGKGDAPYICSVFSFRSGKEELLNEDMIRSCPEDYAKKLDNDPNFSAVREVRFMKDHDPTLQSYLPSEPGDHVMLGKDRCTIIEVHGDEYLLEDGDGNHIMAHSSDVRAGKTPNSARWDHDIAALGAFTSFSPDTIFEGEWVWIDAGAFVADLIAGQRRRMGATGTVPSALKQMRPDNKILALVKHIEGKKVEVVRAFDGETLELELDKVIGSTSKIEGLLNHDSKLATWKLKTLDGFDPHYNAPGTIHPMLALGLGEMDDELLQEVKMKPHMTKKGSTVSGPPRTQPIRVMEGTNEIEISRRKTDAQDALEDAQNQFKSRTQQVVMVDMPSAIPGSNDGTTFLWIAGAVVILAYYNS